MTKKRDILFRIEARFRRADGILPVFLPFAGCPYRCMYCAQDRQTGAGRESVAGALERLRREAAAWLERGRVPEVAFYGGTFTALPEEDFSACLKALADVRGSFAGLEREKGVRVTARCSTRPDCCGAERLERLGEAGVSLVELGVQSFDGAALSAVRRGYDGETVLAACEAVRRAGLLLGVQLMPGMPGSDADVFARDVAAAVAQKPACVRLYPCLVPEGTGLAALWRRGGYVPWTNEEAACRLGEAFSLFAEAGIPVIRLSVAPERDFDGGILAGPRHPALGSLIKTEALLRTVRRLADLHGIPDAMLLPASCQGYIWGDRGSAASLWKKLLPSGDIRFESEPEEHGYGFSERMGRLIYEGRE